jgi:hypothetical protein
MWGLTAETANTFSALAALLQAALLIVSILYVNRQFGILRACSYIERFNSDESIRRRATVDTWLNETQDRGRRIDRFRDEPQLQADVLAFMNLFQEMGVAYLCHNVHKRTARYV